MTTESQVSMGIAAVFFLAWLPSGDTVFAGLCLGFAGASWLTRRSAP